jgi:hypothetical protein
MPPDRDSDTVPDDSDNCPDSYNPDQADTYGGARGDACEPPPPPDRDSDTVPDDSDNCPDAYNPNQTDTYGDAQGDACEPPPLPDRDSDTVPDDSDNCPDTYNPLQLDTYGDTRGDACEPLPPTVEITLVPGTLTPTQSIETGLWTFLWEVFDNSCDFGPLPGDFQTELLYFEEIVTDDGYISDGETAAVFSSDGAYLADAVLLWPDLYIDYFVDANWMVSYFIEFLSASEYAIADKLEFFSDVICEIDWLG